MSVDDSYFQPAPTDLRTSWIIKTNAGMKDIFLKFDQFLSIIYSLWVSRWSLKFCALRALLFWSNCILSHAAVERTSGQLCSSRSSYLPLGSALLSQVPLVTQEKITFVAPPNKKFLIFKGPSESSCLQPPSFSFPLPFLFFGVRVYCQSYQVPRNLKNQKTILKWPSPLLLKGRKQFATTSQIFGVFSPQHVCCTFAEVAV